MTTNIALIPLRAGSKRIKNKNTIDFLNKPLFLWVLKAAYRSSVDKIYISTDDKKIISFLGNYKKFPKKERIIILKRKKELCQDDIRTEEVLLDFAKNYEFTNLILLQATSPYITAKDINEAINLLTNTKADTLLGVSKQFRFLWNTELIYDCCGYPVGHNYNNRLRTQDITNPLLIENGAIYITPRKGLLKYKCRLYGKIALYRMPEDCYLEIDNYRDLYALEAIMKNKGKNETTNK